LANESQSRGGAWAGSRFEALVRAETLPVTLIFAGVVLLAFVVRLVLADQIVTPWIMADELIYSEMAKNFADHGEFLLRDTPSHLDNVAYPALISPAWFAASIETAYGLARTINVVLMVMAAVVVYFWGKRLMSPAYALLAAVLVLLMPAFTYTGMLMTENAFFPAVVTMCFLIALTLERPTLLRQALVLAAIGLTFVVRPQGIVLLPIYVTALALKLAFDLRSPGGPRGIRYVRSELLRFLPTAVTLALLGGVYVIRTMVQGDGIETGLGSYGGVLMFDWYDSSTATDWVVDHFAEIGLSVAMIPVSALIVLLGLSVRGWASSAAERAFVAVAASAFVLIVAQVGIYASRFSLRIEERNMFSVAPLLFLALSLWLARGLPRPAVLTAVAAFAPVALLFSLDLSRLLNIGVLSDTFSLIPLLRLSTRLAGGAESAEALMGMGGFAAAVAFAVLPRRAARVVLPAIVGLFLVVFSYSVFGSIRDHSEATLALTSTSNPSWIDEEIGSRSQAVYLYGATPDPFGEAQIMWQTEFWNRSIGTVYTLGPSDPGLTANAAMFDAVTGRVVPQSGGTVPSGIRYVVAPTTVKLNGRMLAQQEWLALYRINPPMQLATHLGGVYPDSWMGGFAALTHYARPTDRGRIHVRISREGWGAPSPPGEVTIKVGPLGDVNGPTISKVISSRTWRVRSGTARSFTLPTPRVPYRLEIHVEPTFSPATYGQPDPRQLGAQVQVSPAFLWTGGSG
jgi:hypothetical protein